MRNVIATEHAPKAIGPYSQGIVANGFLFSSGQIGMDPATGQLVPGGIQAETRRVMENLSAVLAQAGSGFDRVVRTTVYLADLGDFGAMNEIYGEYFKVSPPARSTVQVARLPRDARVEIDVVALIGE